jgi:transposase
MKPELMSKTIAEAKELLKTDAYLSPAVKTVFSLVLVILDLLMAKFKLNSSNSSKAPSTDSDQDTGKGKEKSKRGTSGKKAGGQKGHNGETLMPVSKPDVIVSIPLDLTTVPLGNYLKVGVKKAQVVDIKFTKVVTEYQADIMQNESGCNFTAPFPRGITHAIQYGASVKEHAVYLATAQFLPYERLKSQFQDQYKIELSCGSIFNFITDASTRLERFGSAAKHHLMHAPFLHSDETGFRVKNKLHWLHTASNDTFTLLEPHAKRGKEAMVAIGILPNFKGIMIHDHWSPYLSFVCQHAFCNAHHLRELTWSFDEDNQAWAGEMHTLLEEMNVAVHNAGGFLTTEQAAPLILHYTEIIQKAERESPLKMPDEPKPGEKKKKGKVPQTKSRNLLTRLIQYQTETLRFLTDPLIPFSNNAAEQSLRMEKVRQKISGCYRSLESATNVSLIRSYLLSCAKNDISASEALNLLFKGEWPDFVKQAIDVYDKAVLATLKEQNLGL